MQSVILTLKSSYTSRPIGQGKVIEKSQVDALGTSQKKIVGVPSNQIAGIH